MDRWYCPPHRGEIVTQDLYLERWLLLVKKSAEAAGLKAIVRAVDRRGGRNLALEIELGDQGLELRCFKRRVGARVAAAATASTMLPPARAAIEHVLGEHAGLLEGGLRRFLRRSLQLLAALESGFELARNAAELSRANFPALTRAPAIRTCAAARLARGLPRKWEALPAFAARQGPHTGFLVLVDGRLGDLTRLVAPRKKSRHSTAAEPVDNWSLLGGILDASDLLVTGVELATGPWVQSTRATETAGEAVDSALVGIEAVNGAVEGSAAAAEATDVAVQVIAESGSSCLSDAACAGLDCGGLDCIPF